MSALDDLSVLLAEKAATLDQMAVDAHPAGPVEVSRLSGKAEGVRLARSFVDEMRVSA